MKPLLLIYPKCSTCQKALKYLNALGVEFETQDLMNDTPSTKQLKAWITQSKLPIKRFFNTSGNLYKEMHLKDTLDTLSSDEQIALLASSGWYIKRPLLITDETILVGFHEELYDELAK